MSMKIRSAALSIVALGAALAAPKASFGQTVVFSRPMMAGGGTLRTSSYWVDPTGENDSDSDSQAWTDFTLAQAATVTRVRWWGQTLPAHGFDVQFYNQDPNTTAVQPHIVGAGSGPFAEEHFAAPTVESVGGGLYQFTVDLATPVALDGGTRYFLSVYGLSDVPWATWSWAQGQGSGWTFWWQRGLHMYFLIGGGRAMELSGDLCTGDVDGSGAIDFGDLLAVLSDWGPCPGCASDLDGNGDVAFADLLLILSLWGPGP
jgi:hypothetical protein